MPAEKKPSQTPKISHKGPATADAVLRWKNGDRQFITVDMYGERPRDEIVWVVGDGDGGNHLVGATVYFRFYEYGNRGLGRFIFCEYP